ncbi:hypothetical protein Hanom_Chr08g00736561 [Helianthus anomalus]
MDQEELFTFDDQCIRHLVTSEIFPKNTVVRPFHPTTKADFSSKKWVCFPFYPFSIGFTFFFSPLVNEFFNVTKLAYPEVMPLLWRILFTFDRLNCTHSLDMTFSEIADVYELRTYGTSHFTFRIKPGQYSLASKTKHKENDWRTRFLFVRRDSIPNDQSLPIHWTRKVRVFQDPA